MHTFYRLLQRVGCDYVARAGIIFALCMLICITACGSHSPNLPVPDPTPAPPSPSGTSIQVTFTEPTPGSIVERSGDGNWQSIPVPVDRKLTFTIPEGITTYQFAYACPDNSNDPHNVYFDDYVYEASIQDSRSYSLSCPLRLWSLANVTVDASAIPNTAKVVICAVQDFGILYGNAGTTSVSFYYEPPVQDMVAMAEDTSSNIVAIKILRAQSYSSSSGMLGSPIRFSTQDAVTAVQPFAVLNSPWNDPPLSSSASFHTLGGTSCGLTQGSDYAVVPPYQVLDGDYYYFNGADTNSDQSQYVISSQTKTAAVAITLTMPEPMLYSAPAAAAFPVFSLNYSDSSGSNSESYSAQLTWDSIPIYYEIDHHSITVTATSAFQNGSKTLAVPDLTTAGFLKRVADSKTPVQWSAAIKGKNADDSTWEVGNRGSYVEP